MVASVESTPTFRAGASRLLFDNRYFLRDPGFVSRTYDISPDGNRFLLIKDAQKNESPSQLVLVLNWPEELKRLATEK